MGFFGGKLQGCVDGHGSFSGQGGMGKFEYVDIGGKELKGPRTSFYLADRINVGETMTISYARPLALLGLVTLITAARAENGRVYRMRGSVYMFFYLLFLFIFAFGAMVAVFSLNQSPLWLFIAVPFFDGINMVFRSRTT